MEMFDFNSLVQPTLPLTLSDDDKTVINITYPDENTVERLEALSPALNKAAKAKDASSIRAVFTVLSEVLNFNEEGLSFTAEELRDKYRINLYGATKFFAAYFAFIKEANDAKN